jgi:regulator of protease activity HflC (stomatin/prohibitin superfamily)
LTPLGQETFYMEPLLLFLLPAIVFVGIFMLQWVRILNEYERGVVFRLGRLVRQPAGPGVNLLVAPPFVDRMVVIDMRTVTLDIPPQDVITRDNISVKVNAVLYFRVVDPIKAVVDIEDYNYATSQISQTTIRSIVGQVDLDGLLSQRDELSNRIQEIIDEQTDPWGVKISNVELKHIEIPSDMQRAIARQAEAERERRAKIIGAEGEYQAAEKLVMAAKMMEEHPGALQMRYLQTLVELGTENSTTVVFPIPIDITSSFSNAMKAITKAVGGDDSPLAGLTKGQASTAQQPTVPLSPASNPTPSNTY